MTSARSRQEVLSRPDYAVIVVTYQREEELDRSLGAVIEQSVGRTAMEICVVNNGGGEHARERWKDRVDVWIDSGHNLGCAGGRNRGVEVTKAPILVFIDDDGVPDCRFVEELGHVLAHDTVAVRARGVALHHPIFTAMSTTYDRGPHIGEDLLTFEGGSAIRRDAYERAGGHVGETNCFCTPA